MVMATTESSRVFSTSGVISEHIKADDTAHIMSENGETVEFVTVSSEEDHAYTDATPLVNEVVEFGSTVSVPASVHLVDGTGKAAPPSISTRHTQFIQQIVGESDHEMIVQTTQDEEGEPTQVTFLASDQIVVTTKGGGGRWPSAAISNPDAQLQGELLTLMT